MSIINVLEIVMVVICAVTYGFMLYFKVRGNILGVVSELIALAEQTGMTGKEKMAQVVAELYKKVPAPLRKILSEKCLESIAQTIFDWMRKYAEEYNKQQDSGTLPDTDEEKKTQLNQATAELITALLKLTVPELKQKAEDYGVDLSGITKKDDIVKAIVLAILEKA